MKVRAFSYRGKRENNEDSFLVIECEYKVMKVTFSNDDHVSEFTSDVDYPNFTLLAVSDGMGGLEYGAEASFTTLNKLIDAIPEFIFRSNTGDVGEALRQSIRTISEKVGQNFSDKAGATLVGVLVLNDTLTVFNTGDSFCKVFDKDHIWENTRHNCLNEAKEKGVDCEPGTEDYLTDNIGMSDVRVDITVLDRWDRIMLSSDGLLPVLKSNDLKKQLEREPSELCLRATELGSTDNVTLIVADRES